MADKHIFDEHGNIIKSKDPLVYRSELDKELTNMEDHVSQKLNKKFDQIDEKFDQIDKRFDQLNQKLDKKFNQIDEKFDQIDERFDQMDKKIDKKINGAIVFLTFLITLLALFIH